MREGGESTIQIPDPGKFITATLDGSEVLLSDGQIYGLEDESLTDLTEGQGGFQGIAGASEDLARVYFVDTKALSPPEEENANGEHSEEGEFNLYLWEEGALPHEGSVRFIAGLLGSDNNQDSVGVWHAAAGNRLAQASADGRYLAFSSRAPLTGYDSRASGRKGCVGAVKQGLPECFEVFEYDAAKETLACASCNPTGLRPLGQSNLSLIRGVERVLPPAPQPPPPGRRPPLLRKPGHALGHRCQRPHPRRL